MTQRNDPNPDFECAVQAMKNDGPSGDEVENAGERVWRKLQSSVSAAEAQAATIHGCEDVLKLLPAYAAGELATRRALVVEIHLRDCVACRNLAKGRAQSNVVAWTPVPAARPAVRWQGVRWQGLAAVAAVVVVTLASFAMYGMYFAVPAGARASVQSFDGAVYRVTANGERLVTVGEQLNEGDVLRTGSGAHAYLKMADGSIIETNERTDLALRARGKNATITLDRGAVIVKAARRKAGHLYVKTPDCRVAVTGTVFSVGAGMKGSRVSVIEGTVQVAFASRNDVLHSGDQVSTGENMTAVPVAEDIAWSRDLPSHLELLAEFSKLRQRLDQVQLPGPRFHSALLARMPADAVVYASLPNAGQALEDANRILQEQIQQSDALKRWFIKGDPQAATKLNETVAKVRQLSDYLGDEVVVVGFGGEKSGVALVAEVRRAGLQDFLKTQFSDPAKGGLVVIDPAGVASAPENRNGLIALVRDDAVVFASNRAALAKVNVQLSAGVGGLAEVDFGKRIEQAYDRGAGFMLAADLRTMIANKEARKAGHRERHSPATGLEDMRYLLVEHREVNGVPDNHMLLDFKGQRRGIASWLSAPAPMGALQFVSRNASIAVAVIGKEPALVLDDILNMNSDLAKQQSEMADAEAKLRLRIREDLAAHFGGDAVIALDGNVLPTPSWKAAIEVHDSKALATSLETLAASLNAEAQREGKPGVTLTSEDVQGQRYYTVQGGEANAKPLCYTFAAGYMILGPNRAVLMNAIRTRITGDSLALSGEFKALLPKDQNANYSMIAYQNLAPILQPLLSQVKGEQVQLVQQLAADSRPSVICAWGRESQIEAATNSRLLGLDWLTVGSLISGGTSKHKAP